MNGMAPNGAAYTFKVWKHVASCFNFTAPTVITVTLCGHNTFTGNWVVVFSSKGDVLFLEEPVIRTNYIIRTERLRVKLISPPLGPFIHETST